MMNICLCNLLIVISLWMFCRSLLSRKYHSYVHEIVLFLYLFGSSYCGHIVLHILLVIIGIFWYVCSKYVGCIGKRIHVVGVYLMCLVMSEVVCANIWNINSGVIGMDYHMLVYTELIVVMFFVLFVLLYIAYQMMNDYKKFCYVWVVCVLPISCLLLIINLQDAFTLCRDHFLFSISLFGIFISNILIFWLYDQFMRMFILKNEMGLLEEKYLSLDHLYKENCRLLHDVSRRVFSLKNDSVFCENEIVCELCGVLFQQFYAVQTDCVVLNRILEKYKQELFDCGICVHSDIYESELLKSKEKLLEQLLRCAIDSCYKVSGERHIYLSTYRMGHVDVCKCSFSCVSDFIFDGIFECVKISKEVVDNFCELTLFFERGEV